MTFSIQSRGVEGVSGFGNKAGPDSGVPAQRVAVGGLLYGPLYVCDSCLNPSSSL